MTEFDAGVSYTFEREHKRRTRICAAQDQTRVVESQVKEQRLVRWGESEDGKAQVLAGVEAGERVAADGSLFLGFFVNPVLYELVAREGDALQV